MLELKDICFSIRKEGEDIDLIHRASITVSEGHFMAIVGPSGCGKTTLLKTIAGINPESAGQMFWKGRDVVQEGDLEASEIGYVPQFSIAYDHLTVEESVETAVKLRVKTRSSDEVYDATDTVLAQVGLEELRDRYVKVLSGGQKRRLGLAMELVSHPALLLCDEVTSGLDPKSEQEVVELMHGLSKKENRIVISVTHSLSNLDLYDSVLVLHEGRVVYHGSPSMMNHYFSVDSAEDVYPQLAKRTAESWYDSWGKHRETYYKYLEDIRAKANTAATGNKQDPTDAEKIEEEQESSDAPDFETESPKKKKKNRKLRPKAENDDAGNESPTPRHHIQTPGFVTQFTVLLARRWKIFLRDRTQLILHIAIMLGFPLLVVIFQLDGFNQQSLRRMPENLGSLPPAEAVTLQKEIFEEQLTTGGLLSGMIMFQVVLLTLMGSNNGAREIASERLILEKEKLGGLMPSSYIASKLAFLSVLVLAQSLWMGVFVNSISQIPGSFLEQTMLLVLVNAAMTAVCLGISSLMKSPEQATLLSIYLVGFQLPLSGAVLALPEGLSQLTRPFIAAYWGWSGHFPPPVMEKDYYEAVKVAKPSTTAILPTLVCFVVLLLHVSIGLFVSFLGSRKPRWD